MCIRDRYKADGIIVASNKFCEYWSYERVIDTVVLQRDFGYPCLLYTSRCV